MVVRYAFGPVCSIFIASLARSRLGLDFAKLSFHVPAKSCAVTGEGYHE